MMDNNEKVIVTISYDRALCVSHYAVSQLIDLLIDPETKVVKACYEDGCRWRYTDKKDIGVQVVDKIAPIEAVVTEAEKDAKLYKELYLDSQLKFEEAQKRVAELEAKIINSACVVEQRSEEE